MGYGMIDQVDGVLLTPLKIIDVPSGDVLHGMKCTDVGYEGFGEAYFSTVKAGLIKGWKRHCIMSLNLVVPVGCIRFVIYDDRLESPTHGTFQSVILSTNNYLRLTVPPMVWVGFQGMGDSGGMLLNIASIPHSPDEVENKGIDEISFDWRSK